MADISPIEDALFNLDDCITAPEASKLTGFSKPTIITWCTRYSIGSKVGGRWYVNVQKLTLLVSGQLKGQ